MIKLRKLLSLGVIPAVFFVSIFTFTDSQKQIVENDTSATDQFSYYSNNISIPEIPYQIENNQLSDTGKISYPYDVQHYDYSASRGTDVRQTDQEVKNTVSGIINDDNVNFRNYPDTIKSDVSQCLNKGDKVSITGRWEDWYKVKTADNASGWVNKKLLDLDNNNEFSSTEGLNELIPVEKPKEITPKGQQIVNYAKKFMGVKYVWGGTTPKGFDCSGFVQYVYRHFGVELERVAVDQATQGIKVKRNNLKPGDLVFFDTDGGHNYINHVGIYIGDGEFIEASSGYLSHKIKITDMSGGFYSRAFVTARRLF